MAITLVSIVADLDKAHSQVCTASVDMLAIKKEMAGSGFNGHIDG
jgi:hypothetical protein